MMQGCRPLTDEEVDNVKRSFHGRYRLRNRAFFLLGVRSGFRLSELLSLRIRDVWQHGGMVDAITVQRRAMKGKQRSRTVPLHREAKAALAEWLIELGTKDPAAKVFDLSSVGAWKFLKAAFDANQLQGHVSTHSMRKTFAAKVYERLDRNLAETAEALGHASVQSTISYLSFDRKRIEAAILSD
jgi:integrase